MKTGLRITLRVLAVLLLLLLALLVIVQSPAVQTRLARKAVERFAGNLDADIEVGAVTVKPFDAVVLRDVVVKDRHPYSSGLLPARDTLLSVGTLSARFSLKGLLHKERISVSRLRLENGSFNYVMEPGAPGEKTGSNLFRVLGLKPSGEPKQEFGDLLEAGRVEVEGFRFRLVNHPAAIRRAEEGREPAPDSVIDWNDLDVLADVTATNLLVKDGEITGDADHIRLREKSGWDVQDVSGKVKVGHGQVLLDNLHIQDSDSDLHLKSFRMLAPIDDYDDFIERVVLEGEFTAPTVLSMQTVRHFAPNLDDYTFKAALTGQVEGTVADFRVRGLSFQEQGSGVSGRVDGSMTGLPDIETTRMDFKAKDFRFTPDGLGTFIQEWSPQTKLDLSKIARGTDFHLDATAKGTLDRLAVQGGLDSSAGAADVDLTLRNILDRRLPITIGGTARTRNLDAGRIAGIDALGRVTLETGLEATLAKGGPRVRIDSLKVDALEALDYDYTGIRAAGTYSGQAFDGRIVCDDPNLNFLLQGKFDLTPKARNAAYQFYANVGYADLNALHLDKRGPSKVSLQADANFIRTKDKDILGEVNLRDLVLENTAGRHDIGDITASAHANDDIYRIRFDSSFADGTFVGEKSPVALVNDLKELIVREELPALLSDTGKPWGMTPYEVNFKFHDSQELLGFLVPGLYVEKNTALKLQVDREGMVTGNITSGRLALQDKYVKDFRLDFDNRDGALHAGILGGAVKAGDFEIRNNDLRLTADNNRFGANFVFDNGEDNVLSRGDVRVEGSLDRKDGELLVSAEALPSSIYYDGDKWDIDSEEVTVHSGDLRVNRLRISNGPQELLVDGGLSPDKTDTLAVRMERFDISLLNSLLMKGKLDIRGKATGRARLISPSKPSIGLLAGIDCDSTSVAGRPVGQLQVLSLWDDVEDRFDIRVRNNLNGTRNIDLAGFLNPKDRSVGADATLNRLDLGYLAPILEGIFNEIGGGLDGKVHVAGTLDKPEISSEGTQIVDGRLGIDFTQVTYGISGPVSVDTEGLHFTQVALTDGVGGKGTVTGGLLFGGFRDMRLDTHVRFNDMKVLGIPVGRKSPISGTVYGSGKVDVTGSFDAVSLNVDARTVKNGDLHIPLRSSGTKASGDLLIFTQPAVEVEEDPYEMMMQGTHVQKKKSGTDLDIRVKVSATPAVTAYIDIGENSLRGQGNGRIDLRMRESQNIFTINGDYTLSQGDFHFSTLGIVNRDFSIQDGSSIRFRGDVMESELDVTGVYTTKADISNLLSSTMAGEGSSRRTVNCLIGITDKLRNPQVKFDIEIPELDPGTEGLVESALNTDDKKMKQFLYLLIANSFLPNDDSGIITTGSTNMLYSNMTGIMAGQLNSIFQKLDIPLDLGLNYQQGTSGNNIFDVALSTQLFNNRVVVNGTIGNRRLLGTTTDEMAGDIDIDIKLDKPGTIRLNLFSHSADQYTSYLDNSQRNGVGIAYQREFNTLRQFFQDLFTSREKREEQATLEAIQPAERRVIQIDSTGKAHPIVTNE